MKTMANGALDWICRSPAVIIHSSCLVRSYHHWTGEHLAPPALPAEEVARFVFEAPFAVLSHGTEPDPVINYANRAAMMLWEMSWEELTHMPSRLTAEVPERSEQARLLKEVRQHGFIQDYSGVRISKSGRRFAVEHGTIWNLLGPNAAIVGQAATFDRWCAL